MMTVVTFAISVKDQDVGYVEVHGEDEDDFGNELGRSSALEVDVPPRHVP
jgi:hypothetical protein